MIAKLKAIFGRFQEPITPQIQNSLNPDTLPEQHPEELPTPRWETKTLHGHVLLDLIQQTSGSTGRHAQYGVEAITRSGKRYTLTFTDQVPACPLVVGWNIQFHDPEGKKVKVGTLTRIVRLDPNGSVYVNLTRPTGQLYLQSLKHQSGLQHLHQLHWEPL